MWKSVFGIFVRCAGRFGAAGGVDLRLALQRNRGLAAEARRARRKRRDETTCLFRGMGISREKVRDGNLAPADRGYNISGMAIVQLFLVAARAEARGSLVLY